MRGTLRDAEFSEYVVARRAQLRRTAYLLCGDPHHAEDLVQTALMKLYAAWPRLREDGNVDAFARRIVVNAHLDETRRPWRRERSGLDVLDVATGDPPDEGSSDDRDVLVAALAALPERQRQVDPMEPTPSWRNGIYDITASVLDPQKKYLDYSTQSLQSGGDGKGGVHLGIKLGWSVPGRPGEGMVQVQLSTETGPDAAGCWEYPVARCHPVVAKGGLRYEIGRGADGQFVIIHEQSDGERVIVYVEPLFGNNSLVPVKEMRVSEGDVLRLVQDDRLNLPR